jgi:hypothetical protein
MEAPAVSNGAFVYYEGHLSAHPHVMVGKLLLNSRYLIFHIYQPHYAGVLQNARLVSTGRVLSIPLSSIVDAGIESGVRAKSSRPNWKNKDDFEKKSSGDRMINRHPGFLEEPESFSRVMLTVETESGVEIASFEVQNPQGLLQSLRGHGKGAN